MRRHVRKLVIVVVVLAIGLPLVIGGCGLQPTGPAGVAGVLDRLKPLTKNCDGPLNAYSGIDWSVSAQGDAALLAGRVETVRSMVDQVAACGGYAKVVAFSGSAAKTFTLGEDQFPTDSGTETARLIQADRAAGDLMEEVEDSLPEAEQALDANGSDILAQLTLAQQYQAQRSTGTLYVGLITDGIATTHPPAMNTPEFTDQVARAEAERVPMPELPGAIIRIFGIGKTTVKRKLATSRTNAMTTFYTVACERTGANCLVAIDYTPGGLK